MTHHTGRVANSATGPLLGESYVAAKALKLGDRWLANGDPIDPAELEGRSVTVMLQAGDIAAAVTPNKPAAKGRKR